MEKTIRVKYKIATFRVKRIGKVFYTTPYGLVYGIFYGLWKEMDTLKP